MRQQKDGIMFAVASKAEPVHMVAKGCAGVRTVVDHTWKWRETRMIVHYTAIAAC